MNLKMPKFGVLHVHVVSTHRFRLFQSAFVVSRDSLRELHVFLPFVTYGTLQSQENFDRYLSLNE